MTLKWNLALFTLVSHLTPFNSSESDWKRRFIFIKLWKLFMSMLKEKENYSDTEYSQKLWRLAKVQCSKSERCSLADNDDFYCFTHSLIHRHNLRIKRLNSIRKKEQNWHRHVFGLVSLNIFHLFFNEMKRESVGCVTLVSSTWIGEISFHPLDNDDDDRRRKEHQHWQRES